MHSYTKLLGLVGGSDMQQDRSKNDTIVLSLVIVLAVLLAAVTAMVLMDKEVPDALLALATGIVGAVAGYVTAGRSPADPARTSDTIPVEGTLSEAALEPWASEERAEKLDLVEEEVATVQAESAVQLELPLDVPTGADIPEPPEDYDPVDPGIEGDTGPEFGTDDDDWFDDEDEEQQR